MNERHNGNGKSHHIADYRTSSLQRPKRSKDRQVVITGGAGFIGANLAHRLLTQGQPVIILDNLSRPGVEHNLRWLRELHGDRLQIEAADVRDFLAVLRVVDRASQVFHFAGQVAITTSLKDPIHDFEVNARGTINLLEALRSLKDPPPLIFASSNKVYGSLDDIELRPAATRYVPDNPALRSYGINEARPLNLRSPYGCSKGMADQCVLDYARTFGLPTAALRMSTIYGPHQFGTKDQGWVAHFLIHALRGKPITIYGDGLQVRDVLFVDSLVDALILAQENIQSIAGQAFNIGGGPEHTTSLIELITMIENLLNRPCEIKLKEWRTGDQRYYVSDIRKFQAATGWMPMIGLREGLRSLYEWLNEVYGVVTLSLLAGTRSRTAEQISDI